MIENNSLATPGQPAILFSLLYRYTPESSRWLLVNGKEEKTRQELAKVARINRISLTLDEVEKPESSVHHGNFKTSFPKLEDCKNNVDMLECVVSSGLNPGEYIHFLTNTFTYHLFSVYHCPHARFMFIYAAVGFVHFRLYTFKVY